MTRNRKVYELTQAGLNEIKQELHILKEEKRPQVIDQLQEAKKHGDLSENAEYDAARDLQAKVESRIKYLQNVIENAQIIKVSNSTNEITLGKFVKLYFEDKDKTVKYNVVGTLEADPTLNKISNESPIGKAIMGKKRNDKVLVQLQNGRTFTVEILEITNE